jgi:hypothetical protein
LDGDHGRLTFDSISQVSDPHSRPGRYELHARAFAIGSFRAR